ncbi:MAG: hypothetical protein R3E83_20280 [Burkholderiaceae bacterium]
MSSAKEPKIAKIPRIDLLDTSFEQSIELRVANPGQDGEIDRLRRDAYASAINFELPDPTTILRRKDPENSVCLVIGTRDSLFATMRIALATDRPVAERLLEGKADLANSYFPGAVLSRGATDPRYRGNGLMGFLVSLGVAVARQCALGSALAVQVDKTPHFTAMEAAGWRSRTISDQDLALVRNSLPLKLVYIERERFARSAEQSRHAHPSLYQRLKPETVIQDAAQRLLKSLR